MPGPVISDPQWQVRLGDHVPTVAVSPDGMLVAAGSLGGDAVLIDAADGGIVTKLVDHDFGVLSASWSPGGAVVAVGGHDGLVRLYGRAGDARATVSTGGWVSALAWSPDGRMLAIGAGRSLTLTGADGDVARRFDEVPSTVTDVAWSPNGKRVGVTSYGGITWYDPMAPTRGEVRRHEWRGSLLTLALSPTGRWACAGSQDATIHLWKLWSGGDLSMSGYPAKLEHLAFRADGRWMASACLGEITVWDFAKSPAGTAPASGEVHRRHISALAWQPDGDVLASAGADGRVVLWPSPRRAGQTLQPLAVTSEGAAIGAMAWDQRGSALTIGRSDGAVELRRVAGRG